MTYSRSLAVLCFIVVMLITALTPLGMPGPTTVDADHDEPATSHLLDPAEFPMAGGRIVRNVILGDPIPVCTDVVPLSALAAVQRWNDFFDRAMNKQVFKLKQVDNSFSVYGANDPACKTEQTDNALGIGSVLIEEDSMACGGFACITLTTRAPDAAWDTYVGQLVIHLGNQVTDHMGVVIVEPVEDDVDRVTNSITHELGHVFGLANWKCGTASEVASNPDVYTMDPTVMGPKGGACRANEPTPPRLVSAPRRDETDYQNSYIPAPPIIDKNASGPGGANEAIIAWDAFNVHVESEFAVERKNANGAWERVGARHPALPLPPTTPPLSALLGGSALQPARITLTGQTPGKNTYRVVSLTRAPLQPATPPASGPHTIDVLAPDPPTVICTSPGPDPNSGSGVPKATTSCAALAPPTVLSVSDVTGAGAMLEWNDATAAAGYKVRRDGIANTTQTPDNDNSHPFTGLTPGTAHVLEVASTHSSGDSHFASLTLLLPPTNLTRTATTLTSLKLTWTALPDLTYQVKRGDGEAESAETPSSHTFRLLASDTDYDLYVRARNAQGPSAWASITARTSSPPPPVTIIDPGPRPQDESENRTRVTSSWVVWEEEGDWVTVCWLQQYRYERYVIETWITTYSLSGSVWVPYTRLSHTSAERQRKSAVGGPLPVSCESSSDGGAAARASADQSQFLTAGDYVFTWGETRVSFTVPADARVDLTWRVLESGVRAAVLTDEGAGEVLVYPGAAAARDARGNDPDKRSAALQSLEGSIGPADPAAEQPAQPPPTPCAVVSADSPPASIDLDTNRCASVAAGGQVSITVAGHVLSLTLTSDRYWVVARLRTDAADGSEPVALFDVATTSSLLLDPATGTELERNIPDDAPSEIGALLDAIAASVQRSDATEDAP